MRSVQIVELGKPLQLRQTALPEPGPGEIRVRVEAAGICHSDLHYRDGVASVAKLPITPGHEIAGRVDALGEGVTEVAIGDRVALHYLISCGRCDACARGLEQFCTRGQMLGKHRDGGYAQYALAPARNAIPVAEGVGMAEAAIMMCSSATAFHALRKARIAPGDRVAVFGCGGLGLSAIQLAHACGAAQVFGIDIDAGKLAAAHGYGAIPVDPADGAPVRQLREATGGDGVEVALEFAGLPLTQRQAVAALAVQGRAAIAGITHAAFEIDSFGDLICREAEVIGVSDHLRSELVTLMEFTRRGQLDLKSVVTETIPLDADAINARLDALAGFRGHGRIVITP
ncbi:zinc-binding dehydrogenase [Thermomonas sp.]|uniref:alcohol dehydrogenase catalytic domain-containing protein n=1 Tax=Thermomonas sp. TaxID=1971895 RepID=UPI002CDF00E3|nr:zinc-binding dehydrogenase [Thermomonas sp.]HRO62380.1 zinc-binding dehydrogenase [Thermomonas sp.]